MTTRSRVAKQSAGQGLQFDHADITQWTGHGTSTQLRLSVLSAGHATPPFEAWRKILRLRCWVPGPQLTLQSDQVLFTCVMQSSGHGWVSHVSVPDVSGHPRPPCAAPVVTSRVSV
jgi:hypothetical protein